MKTLCQMLLISIVLMITGCEEKAFKEINRTPTIKMLSDLVIGLEESEHILGEPVSVRTDSAGNIYIADKASLTIKVFDRQGKHLKNLGGRGRGPTEFYDLNMMDITPEDDFVILDRGNMRYTTLTKEGEFVSSYPIQFENQFYFDGLRYVDSTMIGLHLSAATISTPPPVYERTFFHIYSQDFQTKHASFAPFNHTGVQDMFGWNVIGMYPGSFTLINEQKLLLYSPGIYLGKIFIYQRESEHNWTLTDTWKGTNTHFEPYFFFESESEYQEHIDFPGTNRIYYGSLNPHYGRVNSSDAGIFYMPDRDQVIHFYAEWREGNKTLEEGNLLDISMQLFDMDGQILDQSYLTSLRFDKRINYPLVNWMDDEGRFYLMNYAENIPTVTRFSLDLSE